MKHACMSNVRDPENRSRKRCVCGGHSKKKKRRPKGGASARAFWRAVRRSAAQIRTAPAWKRAGITLNPEHYETAGRSNR